MTNKRGTRNDYTPSVRARAARQDGQRRLTPGYLDDLSDTKTTYIVLAASSTSRVTLVTPATGRVMRIIRVEISQVSVDGLHYFEVYFGTGTDVTTNASKAIDLVRVPDQGQGATRSWARGAGPVGGKNEVLSIRAQVSAASSHKVLVEYTEER